MSRFGCTKSQGEIALNEMECMGCLTTKEDMGSVEWNRCIANLTQRSHCATCSRREIDRYSTIAYRGYDTSVVK